MMRGFLRALPACSVLAVFLLPACSDTAHIDEIVTSLDSEGIRKRNVFFTDSKEAFCIVKGAIGRPGVTLEIYVRQLRAYNVNTRVEFPTNRVLAYAEMSPAASQKELALAIPVPRAEVETSSEEPPFEFGRYQCEAWLDGNRDAIAAFNIDFPPCPPAIIEPGTLCYGFYKEDSACPRYGETSDDPATCRCTRAAGWECL